ncbi:hypothetical protein [Archaeoglobus profundus]|uniref:Uncharacterized protein n=1 Tax=Archaeoglobus profundus (strain DSM 5631 / JCM 9629 / NBRC 100127 / Av18) TaxID=572546 RepID=D2RFL1_ARCPA|nr:hypothetical protein [Archaeoglobus profundus]ADB57086.1 conserved hypothetical protein [Archaeoglobus profundus DSM 5631]
MNESLRLKELARLIRALENAGVYKFSIETFEDRLKLQKIVYIAKHFGIDLGYEFNEYIRGPYSPDLADDYYSLNEKWSDLRCLEEPLTCEEVEKLIEFLRGKSTAELEGIATGLMFLKILKRKGIYGEKDLRELLVGIIKSRKPFLSNIAERLVDTVIETFN